MMPAFESMAMPPILVEVMELGNWARSVALGSTRYWPIMHHEPSAATLTRGNGVGEATMPMAYN